MAWVWLALIVYASLFPFSGWRWSGGVSWILPWPRYHDRFDIWANLAAYLPLGLLLVWRARGGALLDAARAIALACALSYAMEVLQHALPGRVPSLLDWLLNSAGAAVGAAAGVMLRRTPLPRRIDDARARWFERHGADGVALLVLWPLALLFPAPVPLGLGQVWDRLRDLLVEALEGWSWADALLVGLEPGRVVATPLSPLTELLAVALGLLGPCMAAYCMSLRPGRRWLLAVGAAALAAGVTTLSTALNFGPQHALAWVTPTSLGGIGLGLVLACALVIVGRRLAAALGLVAITASIALVAQAPADPYFAESLSAWEQGRFIRFHGLARWIGWGWPYVAMTWLMVRLGSRDE